MYPTTFNRMTLIEKRENMENLKIKWGGKKKERVLNKIISHFFYKKETRMRERAKALVCPLFSLSFSQKL